MNAVYVVGSANFDRFLYVDNFVVAGETISSSRLEEACGGKGLNQAVAAARAGAQTWMVGNLGGDGAGETIRRAIDQENNLHQDFLATDVHTPTGQAMIQVNAEGNNAIVLIAGSNATITREHIDEALANLAKGDVVIFQREIPDEMTKHALKLAKSKGAFTILNLAPGIADTSLLSNVDLLIVNETEAATLLGLDRNSAPNPQDLPARILKETGTDTILTFGDKGAFVATSAETFHEPAMKCEVVDTTGAGDAFVGALAAQLAEDSAISAATRFAIAASTAACGSKGAQSYSERRKDFEKLVKQN